MAVHRRRTGAVSPSMNVAIVIPGYNRRSMTERCLKCLARNVKGAVVVVVDCGSRDGTPQMIAEHFPEVVLIAADESCWWSGATNRGVAWALAHGCEGIVTCNDDNLMTDDVVACLVGTAARHPHALVAATCCYLDQPNRVFFAGRRRSRLTDRFSYMDLDRRYGELPRGVREVDLLHGMFTFIPRSVFDTVGMFDETTFPHLFADDDLALRARARGYRLLVDLRARVFNDRGCTGLNPYDRRLGLREIAQLFTSRKSAYQLTARTAFLWRHRRSVPRFVLTWVTDYGRLVVLVALRATLPKRHYDRLRRTYLKVVS
jgi:GT2 family glycosyltransferase